MADNNKSDLASTAFTGAAFMVATRFAVRLLGLISVTVLARLLTPEDFGLFGTAALILSFFILMKEVGFSEAVIKEKDLTKEDIDTLWTMRLILSALTSLLLYLASPFVAQFLKDARVELILQIMALLPIIDALASPASSLLLRDLNFKADFLLKSGNKIIQVVAVIIVAFILRSYWALVFGALLSSVFGVVITHIVRPYRPRVTLARLGRHINFAAWTYLRGVSLYVANSSDEFVVRSAANTAFFGIYHMARDLARVLIGDLIGPVREAMLPALSRMQSDRERLAAACANIVGAALIVGIALAFGITVTSHELVVVLLGNQWVGAAPFLSLLAIGCACNAIGEVNQSSFVTAGLQHKSAQIWAFRAVLYAVGCISAGILYGPEAVAITFTAISALVLVGETQFLFRSIGVKTSLLHLAVRPLIAGGVMVLAVTWLPLPETLPLTLLLLIKVFVGAATYGLLLFGLWKLTGFEDGPEHTLYTNLPPKLRNILALKLPDNH